MGRRERRTDRKNGGKKERKQGTGHGRESKGRKERGKKQELID